VLKHLLAFSVSASQRPGESLAFTMFRMEPQIIQLAKNLEKIFPDKSKDTNLKKTRMRL
jgi:lauroyl/myristoyl acyltransferase